MNTTTLAAILAKHEAWHQGAAGGKRASLGGANLRGVLGVEANIIAKATGATT